MHTTWILVADHAQARLLAATADGGALVQLQAFDHPEGRKPEQAYAHERPPRTMESVGGARHAIEPHTSAEEKVAVRFAQTLDAVLERGRVEHRDDRLILVAPPHFLGTLRQVLDAQVQACVVAELDKELVAEPLDRLHARVQAHLAR